MKAAFRGSAFARARPPARRLRKSAGGGEGARPLPKVAPYGPRAPPTLGGVDLGFLRVLPADPRPLPRHRTGGLGRLRARPHGSFPATFAHPLGRETHPVRLTLTTPPSRPRRLGSPRPAPPRPIREPGGRHSGLFARRGSQTRPPSISVFWKPDRDPRGGAVGSHVEGRFSGQPHPLEIEKNRAHFAAAREGWKPGV
jgi:hypothetical protein